METRIEWKSVKGHFYLQVRALIWVKKRTRIEFLRVISNWHKTDWIRLTLVINCILNALQVNLIITTTIYEMYEYAWVEIKLGDERGNSNLPSHNWSRCNFSLQCIECIGNKNIANCKIILLQLDFAKIHGKRFTCRSLLLDLRKYYRWYEKSLYI